MRASILQFPIILFVAINHAGAASLTTADSLLIQTHSLAPIGQYFPSSTSNPEATGREVKIFPTGVRKGIPPDGIDVVFGQDIIKDLSAAFDQECHDATSEACRKTLQKILDEPSQHLEARWLIPAPKSPFGIFAKIRAGIWSMIYDALYTNFRMKQLDTNPLQPPPILPTKVHFASTELEKLITLTASDIVLETVKDSGQKSTTTTRVTGNYPSNVGGIYPTASVMTEDQSDHKKGDLGIHIPPSTASQLYDILMQLGIESPLCPKHEANDAADAPPLLSNPSCIVEPAKAVMELAVDPESLLRLINPRNHVVVLEVMKYAQPIMAPVAAVLEAHALALPNIPTWNVKSRKALASITFAIMVFSVLPIPESSGLQAETLQHIYIPKDSFTEEKQDDDDDDKNCKSGQGPDANSPECEAPDCQDKNTGLCTVGKNDGCRCVVWLKSEDDCMIYDSDWEEQGVLLDTMIASARLNMLDSIKSACDASNRVNLEASLWKEQVSTFCKDAGDSKEQTLDSTSFRFSFSFHSLGCELKCEEAFGRFTANTNCQYSSHIFSSSGSIKHECVDASFNVKPLETFKPKPTKDTRYELRVHQEMERDWELWGAHNGVKISGPDLDSPGVVYGGHYKLSIEVRNPTNKDKTNIWFSYVNGLAGTEMSPGTTEQGYRDRVPTKKTHPNYCEAWREEAQWRAKNAGFERDFKCWFNDQPCREQDCGPAFMLGMNEDPEGWLVPVVPFSAAGLDGSDTVES